MYQANKADRRPLGTQLESEIMEYIRKTPLEVGSKLPNEFELMEIFGVGRSTVREAVKALVTKGVLEVRRGAGTYVISTTTPHDDPLGVGQMKGKLRTALDLCEVRLMMEPKIAALAAEKATDEECLEIKYLCDEVERIYQSDGDHMAKDVEFHSYIARCSKNQVVENLIPMITSAVAAFVNVTNRMLKQETIETHRAITEAICNHDPAGAEYAMIMHLNYNRQMILKMIREEKDNKQENLK